MRAEGGFPDVAQDIRRSLMCGFNTADVHTRIIGINYLSVSVASHDGVSEVGMLCGDLAAGKGANLELVSFKFNHSATQLALLNNFHVEFFEESTSESRLNDLGPAADRGLSMTVCCAIPVSAGQPRCAVMLGWESPASLHAAFKRVSQASALARELAQGFPEEFASLARRGMHGPPPRDLSAPPINLLPPPRSLSPPPCSPEAQVGAPYPSGEMQEASKCRSEGLQRRQACNYAIDAGPYPRPRDCSGASRRHDGPQFVARSIGGEKGDEGRLKGAPESATTADNCHRGSLPAWTIADGKHFSPLDLGQDSSCDLYCAEDEAPQKVVERSASVHPRQVRGSSTLCSSDPATEAAFLQTTAQYWCQRDAAVAAVQAVFALAVTCNQGGPLRAWVVNNPWHGIWNASQLLHPLVPLLGRVFAPQSYGMYREWICVVFSIFSLAASGLLWLPYSSLPEVHAVLPFAFTCTLPLAAMVNGLGYKMRMMFSIPERILTLLVHLAAIPSACSVSDVWLGGLGCSLMSVGLFLIAGVFIPLFSAYHFEKADRARFFRIKSRPRQNWNGQLTC